MKSINNRVCLHLSKLCTLLISSLDSIILTVLHHIYDTSLLSRCDLYSDFGSSNGINLFSSVRVIFAMICVSCNVHINARSLTLCLHFAVIPFFFTNFLHSYNEI